MIDSFVLLAPLLLLPVVALLGFVGCEVFFPLEPPPVVPGPGPTGLVAAPGNLKVVLSWDAYPDAIGFNVKRGETSGVYTVTFSPSGAQTMYTDADVTNETSYFYVVTALLQPPGLESDSSEEVMATPSTAALLPFVTPTMLGSTISKTGQFGMEVVVGASDLTIQTLGRAFAPGNSQIHVVKVVDAMGVDVPNAFVTVSMAGGAVGEFRYAPLSPAVVLSAGVTYFIVSQEINGGDRFYKNDTTILTTDAATVPSSVHGGPPYVPDSQAGHSYGPVNFQY